MQKRVPIAVAAILTACGAVATTSAESAPQKSAKPKQSVGGAAGCFDPNLKGYARAVAEQIGGVPCARSATRVVPRSTPASLAGLWIFGTSPCNASASYLRLWRDGRYQGKETAGAWRLAGPEIVFAYRVSGQTEAATSLAHKKRTLRQISPDRITLNGETWRRCSTDPEYYLQ